MVEVVVVVCSINLMALSSSLGGGCHGVGPVCMYWYIKVL